MIRFILNVLLSGLAVFLAAQFLPGVMTDSYLTALIVAVLLGVANAVIKPVLIILTLPINILTLGLFTFVINAIIILIVDTLVPGFIVANFWWALLFSIVLSILNSLLHSLTK